MSYERAVVLPLSISTAAAGLYQKNYLALPYPSTAPVKSGKSILVWGGSSSVGSSAIQLAIATGLDVAATASSRNLEYVRALGVKWAFDYSKESVVNDIVETLQGSEFVGAFDAISSPETLKSTADIVSKLDGGKIATVLATPAGLPSNVSAIGGKISSGLK
jgi:NADPH:quinone reductase-like Zn-dependent oxidoreductase